jgi:hypothetical protein
MNKIEKIEYFKRKLSELNGFRESLNSDNLQEFESLKLEIISLLDDNQRIRFNQIDFYTEKPDTSNIPSDDLPF